jgi:hypothetical protein
VEEESQFTALPPNAHDYQPGRIDPEIGRRGCLVGCFGLILGGILGAFVGSLLGEAYLSGALGGGKHESSGMEHLFSVMWGFLGLILGGVTGLLASLFFVMKR